MALKADGARTICTGYVVLSNQRIKDRIVLIVGELGILMEESMVSNFTCYTPTEVVFGKNTEQEAGRLGSNTMAERVLLRYGSNSAKRSGLLDRVKPP